MATALAKRQLACRVVRYIGIGSPPNGAASPQGPRKQLAFTQRRDSSPCLTVRKPRTQSVVGARLCLPARKSVQTAALGETLSGQLSTKRARPDRLYRTCLV